MDLLINIKEATMTFLLQLWKAGKGLELDQLDQLQGLILERLNSVLEEP